MFTDAYYPYISGVVTSVDMIRRGLEVKGYEVYIVSLKTELDNNYTETNPNIIKFDGINYKLKKLNNFRYMKNLKQKAKYLKKYNFDLIHINTEFSAGSLGILYSKMYNVPVIYTYHTNYEDYFDYVTNKYKFITHKALYVYLKRLIKKYQKHSDVFIAPTKKVADVFRKYGFNFPIDIVPTGVDIYKFKNENIDQTLINYIKNKYNLNNKFVFSSIGRISKEKSIDILINAFVKANIENAVLVICGTGPQLNELISLVDKMDFKNKIIFTGVIDPKEIPAYYNCCDVFLNASTSETQGLTYIEAIASSVPILVKKDKALEDLLIDGKNGFYFNSEEELIDKMIYLKNNKELLNDMKKECFETITNYSKDFFVDRIENIYIKLIN